MNECFAKHAVLLHLADVKSWVDCVQNVKNAAPCNHRSGTSLVATKSF
jgi:hypothetical protein